MSVGGLDVSNFQRIINWPAVAAAGYRFAYCKVTEGDRFADAYWRGNRAGARAAGLVVGGYHFARPSRQNATTQAEHFAAALGQLGPGDLPPALDLEADGGLNPPELVAWTRTFLFRLEQLRPNRHPILYTFPSFRTQQLERGVGLEEWRVWWARYADHIPSGDPRPLFWQFTDHRQVPGVDGPCDADRFLGTPEQLEQLAGLRPGEVHRPPDPTAGRAVSPTTYTSEALPVHTVNLSGASAGHVVAGPGVRALQALLELAGELTGQVDGLGGAGTRAALVAYQQRAGLPADAIAGPATFARLVEQ